MIDNIFATIADVMSHSFTMMVLGMLLYFLKSLVQIKKGTGQTLTLHQYYVANKWHTLFAVASAVTVYFLLYGSPEMTRVTAFGIGFMADSVADLIGQRSGLGKTEEKPNA